MKIIFVVMLMILAKSQADYPDRAYLPSSNLQNFKNLFEPAISFQPGKIFKYPIPNPVIFPFQKSSDILDSSLQKLNGIYTKETLTHFTHSKTTRESGVSNQKVPLQEYEVVKIPVYSFAAYETEQINDPGRNSAQRGSSRFNRVTSEDFAYGFSSKETGSGGIAHGLKNVDNASGNKYHKGIYHTFYNQDKNNTKFDKPDLNRRYTSINGLKNQNLYTRIDFSGINPLLRNLSMPPPISTTSFKSPFVFYQYEIPRVDQAVQRNLQEKKISVPGQQFHTKVTF